MQQGNVHLSPLHERSTPLKHKPGNPALPPILLFAFIFCIFQLTPVIDLFYSCDLQQPANGPEDGSCPPVNYLSVYHEKQK